ncbi:ATP-NAD kinase [Whalleya microplaca]|nr:ATP-NAD kinase [Whalleya microplaca]
MIEGANGEKSDDASEDKHVHFHDRRDSSASDDDMNALEVTFDPTNPYRRKSSLVTSDTVVPKMASPSRKTVSTQCLVHQFLEAHRRSGNHVTPGGHHTKEDVSKEVGLHDYVEPKGTANRHDGQPAEGPESGNSTESGQADEKAWKNGMTKHRSFNIDQHEDFHSRLLTKKQLSDMAWGVRELSRRLGSVKLKFRVRNIFLLTKVYDHELIPKTREIAKWLLSKDRDVRYIVWIQDTLKDNEQFDVPGLVKELRQEYIEAGEIDSSAAQSALDGRLRFWEEKICRVRPHTFDFIITLGGDGTVLYTSWLFQRIVPPVLSFSLGSLGFLTKFDFNEYEDILNAAFQDGVTCSLRLRFEGTVMRSQKKKDGLPNNIFVDEKGVRRRRDLIEELVGEERDDEHTHRPDGTFEILNEIVVDRGPNPTMSYTEIFGDDEHFTSVLADGVCVSTPTGSTAYNLAAGGSLCHPENPVMLVTSICAHTLSFRPIILPDTIVLRVGVPYDARTSSWASFDGRERVELAPGDYVTISASRFPFASVQPPGRRSEDWVKSISGKLGWNTRQKQKNEGYMHWGK